MKVRFAPSPTGYLHVGNARVAIANWLLARRHAGVFLLRSDDTDTTRSRADYADAIAIDLRWLGLDWDGFERQSDRLERYAAAADRLRASGRLYPCFESEEELRAKRDAKLRRHLPPIYDRAMLSLTAEQRAAAEANGKRPYWRFLLSGETVGWEDGVFGRREVKLSAVSDPVVIRTDGAPLYTLTSVVDDIEHGITDIVRGEDHITNTGVQIDIFRALGAAPPRFAHLPLLTDSDGGKLSKRLDSLTLRTLRHDGVEPVALAAYLARLGTSDDPVAAPLAEQAAAFDLGRFSHAPARFDTGQLLALNRRVLHALPFEAVAERLPAGADARFWHAVRGNLDLLSEAGHWWDVVAGTITPHAQEGEGEFLRTAAALLPPEPWDDAVWPAWTEALKRETGRKGRALFMPLRLALTAEDHGPELRDLLPLIGRARAEARLLAAAR